MYHIAALRLTGREILEESMAMPDGAEELELNFQQDMLEHSFETTENVAKEQEQCTGMRPRLSCFTSVATEECPVAKNESVSSSFDKQNSETDSTSDKTNDISVGEPNKSMTFDIEAMLDDSFEACV